MNLTEFVKPLYKDKDSMHDFSHILRIRKRVSELKKNYSVDEGKLEFLIYFHGLKDYVKKNEKKIVSMGFPKEWINALYRHTKNPKSVEEKIVCDANSLDNVGKSGLKKCIEYGKSIGRSEEESVKYFKKEVKRIKFYTKEGKLIGNEL
ncbi:hypothetical protein GF378_03390 [Candidatus Pacearchaeota archaeon]|nr:hypothetical protein [Candidatus Pacearchaeota archaeon]